jgi:dTDP-4-dehydrorhamnose reductase
VRVLILGGDGMLGHQLVRTLSGAHEVGITLRREESAYRADLVAAVAPFFGVDVRDPDRLPEVFDRWRPQAVVNAVGVVKQRADANDPRLALEVNALFPHRLAQLAAAAGARVIHVSTDCVFSGRRGGYRETDPPDPEDLYGRTKLLGELTGKPALTLRTSIIGLEVDRRQGLVEWFLASRGVVKGYRRAVFSGLTTMEMGRLIARLLERHPDLWGLFHVASAPIDKHALLSRLASALGREDVRIEPDDALVCDRSLCAEAFRAATGYEAPSWDEMLGELATAVRERKG